MRVARVVFSLACVAPMVLAIAGCPSLDGFVSDGGATLDADAEAAAPPGGGYLSLEDAVAFCTKALTCPDLDLQKSTQISLDIPIDGLNFAACVNLLTSPLPSDRVGVAQAQKALKCAVTATSCGAAAGCMWFEFLSQGDPRCVGYTGGNFGACSPNLTSTYDCNFGFIAHCDNTFNYTGSSCLKGSSGYYFCAVSSGLCSASDASTLQTCSGSFYEYCNEGLLVGYDCNVQGMTCGQDPNTQAWGCLTNGHYKPCSSAGTVTCDGTSIAVCDGITTSEINCGTLGGTCDKSGSVPRCAFPNDTCSPYDGTSNVCDGDAISLCIAGQPYSFDCASVGMHCVAGSGKISAHCG